MNPLFTLIIAASIVTSALSHAAPPEHLASVPTATAQEKEIIALLQIGKPSIDQNGRIRVPVYNPTKYDLTGCVIRVTFPAEKLARIYYSEDTLIVPFKDGGFEVLTSLNGKKSEDMKVELLKLSFKNEKS